MSVVSIYAYLFISIFNIHFRQILLKDAYSELYFFFVFSNNEYVF